MHELRELYLGEMMRMRRYNVTAASLVVLIMWVLVLRFAGAVNIGASLPLVLYADSTMMAMLLIGVIMLFEKQEGATRSMLVLPVGRAHYLGAKILATVTSSVITLVLLLVYAVGFRGLTVNIPGIFAAVVLSAVVFALLGVVITYRVRDFTGLLMATFALVFVLILPTFLEELGLIGGVWLTRVQYLNPAKSALLILAANVETVPGNEIWTSTVFLAALGAVLAWLALRDFDSYAAKEIGG